MNRALSVSFCILAGLSFTTASAQGPAGSSEDKSGKPALNTQTTVAAQVPAVRTGDVDATQKPSKALASTGSPAVSEPKAEVNSSNSALSKAPNSSPSASDESSLTAIYRVGAGDVIDIRIRDLVTNGSTLFTVLEGGSIDLPVIGGTVPVAGLTTEEIQAQLADELKRRALQDTPKITVGVRQYASHTVLVTGLVVSGGTKILRREAVPLYVVLAESQSRLDAARASIMRPGKPVQIIDLTDPASSGVLVRPGDVINIAARPEQFYYIGGRINYPGQKGLQSGITLLQSILAAGGLRNQSDGVVEISREGPDGNLTTTKYSVKEIKSGRVRDPRLQAGDRIEIIR
jgi:protein involved in polysaccharide export with SLBB domain